MNSKDQHIDPVGLLPKVLSGEATSEEIRIVSEWVSGNEENRQEYESFKTLWNLTAPSEKQEIDLEREWQKMASLIEPEIKTNIRLIRILQIAASIILISILTYTGFRVASTKTMKSPSASLASFNLPDGSRVSLNAGSKISFKKGFGDSHRNLTLKGEGYFEVQKSQTPFIIDAGDGRIRVTGTKFNISAYEPDQELRVTVTEGSVKFYNSRQLEIQAVLNAGETGLFNTATNSITKDTIVNVNDFAWRTGIIEFNNTPLGEVTDVLQNTYHIPIVIDTAVMRCTITVRFEKQEADSVLNVLRSTLDLTITRKGKQVLITGDGC